MASVIESPGFHSLSIRQFVGSLFRVYVECFQPIVGTRPGTSGPTSTPVVRPKPNFLAHFCSGCPRSGGRS